MALFRAAMLICVLCQVSPGRAGAAKPQLRLERVDATSCATSGALVAHLTEVDVDGTLPRRPLSEYGLVDGGGAALAQRPTHATTFVESRGRLQVAIVLKRGPAYEPDFAHITSALTRFVRGLSGRARFTLVAYDHEARRLLHRGSADQTLTALGRLRATDSLVDPALLAALQMGLDALSEQRDRGRRLLVVLSDGIDRLPDWDQFRNVGRRAARLGAPIFPIAFSPIDERGPLLNLGEIAKRSRGTFRWAQQAEQIPKSLEQLARELDGQRLLSFAVASCSVQRARISAGGLYSNWVQVAVAQPAQQAAARSARGVWWWAAVVLGLLALMASLAVAVRFLFGGLGQPRGPGRGRKRGGGRRQ